jgi:predicted HTH transcriptional regulator
VPAIGQLERKTRDHHAIPVRPLLIFVSSVQKELELERAALASLITTDPFLLQHCVPVLFERQPAPPKPSRQPYLKALRQCAIYVLIIANEYGSKDGKFSATHHEYRLARKLKLPALVFIKGPKDDARSVETKAFIEEIKKDGFTYKRFHDREDLKPLAIDAIRRALADSFEVEATAADVSESEHLIEAASTFESTVLPHISLDQLDRDLLIQYDRAISSNTAERIFRSPGETLHARGMAVADASGKRFHPTAGALLLFGSRPADRFPQCEILADAYDGAHLSGKPKGQATINAPISRALELALGFVDQHTFHPHRVVGLNNVRLNEYPTAALREALVNAVAHRSYEDNSRKIFLRVFKDRVEISSPGYPPKPLTLAKLRRGGYRPCSRNPLIAQTLAAMAVMEQRGSGFARMREAMLNHGLQEPQIGQQDGFFVVTLPGPNGDYDRIRTPANVSGPITPAIETQLNERQKKIVVEAQRAGFVTSGWCRKTFGVALLTAQRDLGGLMGLGLLERKGKGRTARYVPRTTR